MFTITLAVILFMIYGGESLTLEQSKKIWVKSAGKSVSFICEVTGLSTGGYVHWYHKRDGGTLKRLLYISDSGVPTIEAKGFVAEKKENSYEIKLHGIKNEHAGVYYCASWDGSWIKRFGSGTRLIVTDKPVVEPQLMAYSRSKEHDKKNTMLCQASGMFPDLVKFSWQSESSTGVLTDLTSGDVVEQRDEKEKKIFVTSMLIVDEETAKNNDYQCTVEHEGSKVPTKSAKIKRDSGQNSGQNPEDDSPNPTCPPSENTKQNLAESVDQKPSFYLFVYAYGIMLMKNGVYLVTVCIFLLKRKAGKKDESSQEPSK